MSKEIKAIRCYQSVSFQKDQHTSFSSLKIPNRPQVSIKLEKLGASTDVIEVSNDEDTVHIPMSNISGIYYFNKRDEEKQRTKQKEEENAKEVRSYMSKNNKSKKVR